MTTSVTGTVTCPSWWWHIAQQFMRWQAARLAKWCLAMVYACRLICCMVAEPGEDNSDATTYADKLREWLATVHWYALEHLKIETEHWDAVWLYNPLRRVGFCPSLQRPWEGPFPVTKRISDVVYRIQRSERSKPKVVHHDRLRLYEESEQPKWHPTDTVTADQAETEPHVDDMSGISGENLM